MPLLMALRPLAATAAVIAALLSLAGCQDAGSAKSATAGPQPRPVLVQHAAYLPREASRSFVGTIRPRVETDLGFRVAGKIERRLVNVGDVVRAGQPLATLDEADLRLQADQAEAESRAAAATLKQAEADLVRSESLTAKGYAAVASLDRQRATTAEARSRLLRAERALTIARNAVSYAALLADADGVVMATQVEPGQVVSAGQGAIRIAHTGEKEAVVAIPESFGDLAAAKASVALWSRPGQAYPARLREVSPAADPSSRTYLAKFAIPAAGDEVQLGMTATVTLALGDDAKIVRLPLSALYSQGGDPAVWTVTAEGRPVLKPVEVAGYEARDVLIGSGLAEGEPVVTLGVAKLDAGQTVRVVERLRF